MVPRGGACPGLSNNVRPSGSGSCSIVRTVSARDGGRNSLEGARQRGRVSGVGGLLALSASAFGVFGLWAGCSAVLLADLSRALGISPGPLGVALFAGAGASLAAMATLGWTVDRFGRKKFLVVVACVLGMEISGLALAGSFWAFVVVLVLFSPAGGLYDVGINAVAVDLERLSGRRFMSLLHALYSGGAVAGALGGGALLAAGVHYKIVYLSLLMPLTAVISSFAAFRFPRPGGDHDLTSAGQAGTKGRVRHRDLYRNGSLLLVAAVATLALASEREMQFWSAIYLRDSLGMGALLGGSGVAVFFGAMALGRLGTALVVTRLGNRGTLVCAGGLAAAGMSVALATTLPALVICGFLLVGLAISGMAPLAYSVAGDLVPGRAGAAVSVVTAASFGGGLIATPAVGGIAELTSLRAALGLVVLSGLAVSVLSLRLRGQPG